MSEQQSGGGLRLIEWLVLIGLLGLAVGLLLPAFEKVRGDDYRTQCQNNLKQIVLAVHNLYDTYGRLPPAVGAYPESHARDVTATSPPPSNFGGVFYYLLPYMEAGPGFKNGKGTAGATPGCAGSGNPRANIPSFAGVYWSGFNSTFSAPWKWFQCPSDPSNDYTGQLADTPLAALTGPTSLDATGRAEYFSTWGTCSYAFNGQVLLNVDRNPADGGPGGYNDDPAVNRAGAEVGPLDPSITDAAHPKGYRRGYGYFIPSKSNYGFDGKATIPGTFKDGLSNTILVAEKYARCNSQGSDDSPGAYFQLGGNYWAYDAVDHAGGLSPSGYWGFNVLGNGPPPNDGYLKAGYGTIPAGVVGPTACLTAAAVFPLFACNLWDGPGTPLFPGNEISIGPASRPLFRPSPFTGRGSRCDPRLPSTAHETMQVGLADGSCRSISRDVSGFTWWAAVTPDGGDEPGGDW